MLKKQIITILTTNKLEMLPLQQTWSWSTKMAKTELKLKINRNIKNKN